MLSSLPIIAPPNWEQVFFVNLSVKDTLGALLMKKDEMSSLMRPIYFSSRMMTGAKKGFNNNEKVILALMFVVTKFWSYLLPWKFTILTLEETFPTLLQHMDKSPRIAKWLLKLQEFEYTIQVENSTLASLAGLLMHLPFEKRMKSNTPAPPPPVEVKLESTHSLFFDGAYKRIIDKAAAGMVVYDPLGNKIYLHGRVFNSSHSNNEAEYQALIAGLKWCVDNGVKKLNVYGDALLLMK